MGGGHWVTAARRWWQSIRTGNQLRAVPELLEEPAPHLFEPLLRGQPFFLVGQPHRAAPAQHPLLLVPDGGE